VDFYEFAVLVTSLKDDIDIIAQHYRDRADSENVFDELKNQWGWQGFTTHDLKRSQIMARIIALIYNWWTLFVRLINPKKHTEALTSRPLLLHAVGKQTSHSNQTFMERWCRILSLAFVKYLRGRILSKATRFNYCYGIRNYFIANLANKIS